MTHSVEHSSPAGEANRARPAPARRPGRLADLSSIPMWFSASHFVVTNRLSALAATPFGTPRRELLDPG